VGECYFFDRTDPHRDLRLVDRVVKRLGVVMSEAQRREVVNQNFSVVVGGKVAVDTNGRKIFIAPFVKIPLGRWRERCRVLKIPPKVRGYLVKEGLCGILSTEIFTDVWRSGRS
jgi:tRNA(Ile)-lysidine synthase